MTSRREFLKTATAAGGALLAGVTTGMSPEQGIAHSRGHSAPLDILVLGGTGFIGPHLVRYAVAQGHRVTIFTRGRREAQLPDGVIRLIGDRNGQLGALEGKRWDAVIDDSATNPDWVKLSTELLKDSVGLYSFTSSTGVYYPYLRRGLDESVAPHTDVRDANDGSERYGVSKARCEQQVQQVFKIGQLLFAPRTSWGLATRRTASRIGPCAWRAEARF
jgi:2'-hydroxyisoflavone reductase